MKIVALDVGTKRIGVARADTSVRIAIPDGTIVVNGHEFDEIAKILKKYHTDYVVLGLPRNSKGLETAQSAYVRDFSKKLKQHVPTAKIRFQDESLTSVEAENRLKSRKGLNYTKGEVDTEAATIILQDFIENFSASIKNEAEVAPEKPAKKKLSKGKKAAIILIPIFVVLSAVAGGAVFWYNLQLSAPVAAAEDEETVVFKVNRGDATTKIADNLEKEGLIKSSLAFQIYYRLNHANDSLKVGEYKLKRSMSAPDIAKVLVEGENESNVFKLTILPGETVAEVKKKLIEKYGYNKTEVDAAFAKNYDHPALKDRADTSSYGAEPLEGYLYGDTYEFYKGESVEKIIETTLDALWDVVQAHGLETKFAAQGLDLYQGITLASIVQREASSPEQPKVAKVFLNRIARGIPLGSDVTTQYALDLVDPERKTYTNNADALKVNSPYNTRLHAGLTPGPISNPGLSALLAVADPTDTDALYFLTGDDGMMYYSSTEQGHNQNIRDHCRELCNVSL
ncbi:endolytic transglycosylase MltG [Candidatus Saccharibacteria bacterium]|nr:endolytic transglycosylase MltG [Candidatus Saccharibacteria bacterium]